MWAPALVTVVPRAIPVATELPTDSLHKNRISPRNLEDASGCAFVQISPGDEVGLTALATSNRVGRRRPSRAAATESVG